MSHDVTIQSCATTWRAAAHISKMQGDHLSTVTAAASTWWAASAAVLMRDAAATAMKKVACRQGGRHWTQEQLAALHSQYRGRHLDSGDAKPELTNWHAAQREREAAHHQQDRACCVPAGRHRPTWRRADRMIMLAPSDRNPASWPSSAMPAPKAGDSPCTGSCKGHGGRL